MKEFISIADNYIKVLTNELSRLGKKSTGLLIRSLKSNIIENTKEIKIQIISEDYLDYIDKGRKPGSYPPIQKLKQWARIKGLREEAAWGIATNIYKFGIKPTNIYSLVEQKTKLTTKDTLESIYAEKIKNEIKENFKNGN